MSVRRRVLTAAKTQIMENGVRAATPVRIAARAGVDLEDLRREFPEVHDLLMAVHEEAARELNGAVLVAARTGSQDGFEPIIRGCARVFELYVADGPGRHLIHALRQEMTLGEWNIVDRKFGIGALTGGLQGLASQGLIADSQVIGLAVVLYGLVTEACVAAADGVAVIAPDELSGHVRAVLEAAVKSAPS